MSGKKRVGAVGLAVAIAAGYAWGGQEEKAPGTTAEVMADWRYQGATIAANGVGVVQDVRSIAGPALADLGSTVGGAVTPADAEPQSLTTVPPGGRTPGQ